MRDNRRENCAEMCCFVALAQLPITYQAYFAVSAKVSMLDVQYIWLKSQKHQQTWPGERDRWLPFWGSSHDAWTSSSLIGWAAPTSQSQTQLALQDFKHQWAHGGAWLVTPADVSQNFHSEADGRQEHENRETTSILGLGLKEEVGLPVPLKLNHRSNSSMLKKKYIDWVWLNIYETLKKKEFC